MLRFTTTICAALLILCTHLKVHGQEHFTNVADSVGIFHYYADGVGGGVSFYDFNQDGLDDLTFATSYNEEVHFYLNNGGSFTRLFIPSVSNIYNSKHIIWVDYDNDGDADLFVTSFYQNHLYRNNGQLEFEDVTELAQLPLTFEPTYGATWGDFDRDGWLDLYVTDKKTGVNFKNVSNHLYRNIKGEIFEEITLEVNAADSAKAPFCAAFLDINNNGWQDIYIAQDRIQGNSMLKNLGNGLYEDFGEQSGTALRMNAMCVAVADYNNDEYLDIYVSNTPEGNALFKNNGDETFSETAAQSGVGFYEVGWGSSFFDYDNDGLQDLYVCNMFGANKFYHNQDGENFEEQYDMGFDNIAISYSSAIGDFNNDGYPDLAINNADFFLSTLWENPGISGNNWVKISLTGTYSNHDGIGCRIIGYANGKAYTRYTHSGIGYLAQNSQYEIMGIGEHNGLDSLKIHWLSGVTDTHYNIPSNSTFFAQEGENCIIDPRLNISGKIEICSTDRTVINGGYFTDRFTYLWSSGETGATKMITENGIYSLQLEDPEGNRYFSDTLQVVIRNGPKIENSIISNPGCYGSNDGVLEIEISGGIPPYQVNWDNGQDGVRIENLGPGEYDVEVIDQNGCRSTASFEIISPEAITITALKEHDYDNASSGSIQVQVEGGTPPYSYFWSNDFTNGEANLLNLSSGVYTLMVVDSKNCIATMEFEILAFSTLNVIEDELQFASYPNPVSDYIVIEDIESSVRYTLYDLKGKARSNGQVDKSGIIDVNNLPAGVYILKIGNFEPRKIIIE